MSYGPSSALLARSNPQGEGNTNHLDRRTARNARARARGPLGCLHTTPQVWPPALSLCRASRAVLLCRWRCPLATDMGHGRTARDVPTRGHDPPRQTKSFRVLVDRTAKTRWAGWRTSIFGLRCGGCGVGGSWVAVTYGCCRGCGVGGSWVGGRVRRVNTAPPPPPPKTPPPPRA